MMLMTATPANAQQMLQSVADAILAADFARASDLAAASLARGVRHPILHKARALRADQLGRHGEALRQFEEARRLDPNDPYILGAIAVSHGRLGDHAGALAMLDAALALDPDRAETHYQRGWVLESRGDDLKGARASYRRALEINPAHLGAMSGLTAIAVRLQDWPEARARAAQVLERVPGHATAHVAMAAAEIEDKEFIAAEARLRKLLGNAPSLALNVRAVIKGLLGDALDGQDRTAEAFAAHTAENEDERELHARFKQSDAVPAVNAIAEFLETLAPQQWRAPIDGKTGNDAVQQHVFLMGFPRSGTTLLEQILASHPNVVGLEERECMAEAGRRYLTTPAGLAQLMNISDVEILEARRKYWNAVRGYGIEPGGKVFVDKVPMHTIKLPLIAKLFPNAKILFALRDPRDVVLSCFRRHLEVSVATYEFLTLDGCARLYDRVMTIGALSRAKLPLACHVQRHEDLVADLEAAMKTICAFLGIAWTEAMADFARVAKVRDIRSLSGPQVRRGLNRDGIDQWRRYAAQMAPVLPILEPWVERFGYPAA